ncbi:MAG: redox-sensing transcriptional repressor Rex [Microthrixaceae bacterium]|nr:redox-sensing transcriptional repressor Rex [Microthrixaceae bacterium]
MPGRTPEPGEDPREIPDATIVRLPLYHRALMALDRAGESTVSSEQLASIAGVNAAKVRKDLSYFGSFGTRGVGYDVPQLLSEVRAHLGIQRSRNCIVVGAGHLGTALLTFAGFADRGFSVVAAVDVDPDRVGSRIGGIEVGHQDDLDRLVRENDVVIALLSTPPEAAQQVADDLVAAGVRSILNFAPTLIEAPEEVVVRNVDLASELEILAFHEGRRDNEVAPAS